jgi:hypothetical protein
MPVFELAPALFRLDIRQNTTLGLIDRRDGSGGTRLCQIGQSAAGSGGLPPMDVGVARLQQMLPAVAGR